MGVQEPTAFPTRRPRPKRSRRIEHELARLKAIKKPTEAERARAGRAGEAADSAARSRFPARWSRRRSSRGPIRVLPRGNWLDETGPVVLPGVPAFLPPLAVEGPPGDPARPGAVAGRRQQPAVGPGHGQPALEAGLRPGAGDDARRLRLAGSLAHSPRAARLAGVRIRRRRLGRQGDAQADGHVGDLPPVVGRARGNAAARPRQPLAVARQNRFRLDAELVRDNALACSGLLSGEIGGPERQALSTAGLLGFPQFPQARLCRRQGRKPVSPRPVHLLAAHVSCTPACWPSMPRRARNAWSSDRGRTRRSRPSSS